MVITNTGQLLNWKDAINHAFFSGMFIPNKGQCESLGLVGCWTSSTCHEKPFLAYVGCSEKPKSKYGCTHPLIMISVSNYKENTISYASGDEGDGRTQEKHQ